MHFSYRYSTADGETVDVHVVPVAEDDEQYRVTVGDQVFELSARLFQRAAWVKEGGEIILQYEGKEYHLAEAGQRQRHAPGKAGDLRAPMAGRIIRVLVRSGDHVRAGDTLLILEAMKMEQQIVAPQDGVVAHVLCQEGEQVAAGMELVVLHDATEAPSEEV